MAIYTRYKRGPDGFRALVELLETTPKDRRQKMIDAGMKEDEDFTHKALKYMMTFEDIINLPDMELAEVIAKAPPRMTAYAIEVLGDAVVQRFLKNAKNPVLTEIRDYLGSKPGTREIAGAQFKLVATARQLEKAGLVKTKKIPS